MSIYYNDTLEYKKERRIRQVEFAMKLRNNEYNLLKYYMNQYGFTSSTNPLIRCIDIYKDGEVISQVPLHMLVTLDHEKVMNKILKDIN